MLVDYPVQFASESALFDISPSSAELKPNGCSPSIRD
jgi:hypothetical protein